MDINAVLKPIDNLFKSINDNKIILLLILILLGMYAVQYNESVSENAIYLFDNTIFKFVLFIIITYI